MNVSLGKMPIKNEVLAGLTVAMTMIPESLSFAIVAGVPPISGLYAAFIMGIITAILGGRPGMVSGGAGATIVVMIALIATYGIEYLFATVVLAGIIQFLVGAFKFGKFISLIPQPVMYGFLNGLAIIIFMAQLEQFKNIEQGVPVWMTGSDLYTMIVLTLVTIAIVLSFPKITKTIPASLVAILVVFAIVYFGDIETKKVIDIAAVKGSLPPFHIPKVPFTLETLQIIFPYALIMAGVGLIESLLTLNMVDEITNTKGDTNKEAKAQGIANVANGFFTGMGGCAMVAQTLVNLNAGSKTRLGAIIGALTILFIILIGAPVIEQIPLAALVGVMMIVAIKTFQWVSIKVIPKFPATDIFVGIVVAAITVLLKNLALAVLIGVVIAALVFAWDNAKRIRARKEIDALGRKHYHIYGPLFFASTSKFLEKFDPVQDPDEVIINFKESRIVDMSALEALRKLNDQYIKNQKTLSITGLNSSSMRMVQQAASVIPLKIIK